MEKKVCWIHARRAVEELLRQITSDKKAGRKEHEVAQPDEYVSAIAETDRPQEIAKTKALLLKEESHSEEAPYVCEGKTNTPPIARLSPRIWPVLDHEEQSDEGLGRHPEG
jgi:hypothetical protein